ncbi:hypothetical protein CHF27_005570 [Romboutsia maritimum]|uniref:SPOR domain-containing protein n=1 Tax=Romboutsia maritimum TaxID=2020948 RepID=A0A371IU84_9FIRM|nr:hypothetical protein [Romboutsia maritimum]RDY24052.1 hypothetical protein CHF27_005570 [Romboutsia maritimum]
MNKRRRVYRGFNKKHQVKKMRILTTILCLSLIGGYGYIKLKDSNIFNDFHMPSNLFEKISFLDKLKLSKSKIITNKDLEKELSNIKDDKEKSKDVFNENEKQKKSDEVKESKDKDNVKLATIEGWSVYDVQVASVDNDKDLEKIEGKLTDNKIPFSVVQIDKLKKVQTYSFFDKDTTRSYLEKVRKVFPDSFVAEMKVPTLSLEYTNKYKEIENISKELNKLITSFKEESTFWIKNTKKVDLETYNKILTDRKNIVESLGKFTENINYSEMNYFKENLIKYTKDVNEKIDTASKSANEQQSHISQSLLISCMQGYFSFIESIQKA